MRHYHGTPIGGKRQDVAKFLAGRNALVPFLRQDDLGVVADVCQSFVFDNSAFSMWRREIEINWIDYLAWVADWCKHPGFDWALIPDEIEGNEADNDAKISAFQDAGLALYGVPVWHLHESPSRLLRLCEAWPTVAIGSSGQWPTPGTSGWWRRMSDVMDSICDDRGRPAVKLHGLRMLDPEIFVHLPLSSADSTNAAVNSGSLSRFGCYTPPTAAQRAAVIADRIEAQNSAAVWTRQLKQSSLLEPL